MTIWTNKFQIIQIIVISISVFVMNLQNFVLSESTSFALFSSDFQQPNLKKSLCFNLVPGTVQFIFDALPVFVCATPTTCFLIKAS